MLKAIGSAQAAQGLSSCNAENLQRQRLHKTYIKQNSHCSTTLVRKQLKKPKPAPPKKNLRETLHLPSKNGILDVFPLD